LLVAAVADAVEKLTTLVVVEQLACEQLAASSANIRMAAKNSKLLRPASFLSCILCCSKQKAQ